MVSSSEKRIIVLIEFFSRSGLTVSYPTALGERDQQEVYVHLREILSRSPAGLRRDVEHA